MIYQKRINWSVNSKCINLVNLYSYQQLKVKVTQMPAGGSHRPHQRTFIVTVGCYINTN